MITTLFGVSVLNGVVLMSEIVHLHKSGRAVDDALEQASRDRLRPILMASLVALFGFIPMALSTGDGAEVQRPLATVVIGGLLTSTPSALRSAAALPMDVQAGAVEGRSRTRLSGDLHLIVTLLKEKGSPPTSTMPP